MKKIRYFFISLMLVALIGAYVGMNFFVEQSSGSETTGTVQTTPTDPDTNIDADIDNEASSSTTKKIPTKPLDLVNYALDIFNNGKGCQGTTTMLIDLSGYFYMGAQSLNASVAYHTKGNMQRKGDEYMQEDWMWFDSVRPTDLTKAITDAFKQYNAVRTGYQAINVNTKEDSVISVQTADAVTGVSYDLNSASGTKATDKLEAGLAKYIILYGQEFPLQINESTVSITQNDFLSNPKVQYITVSYNPKLLPQNYEMFYKVYSVVGAVQYKKYAYTFEISKKSGRLLSITRDVEFKQVKEVNNATFSGLHLALRGTTVAKINFTTMDNDNFEINKPYLKYTKPEPEPPKEDKPAEEAQPNDKPEENPPAETLTSA